MPRALQGQGRHDAPDLYGAVYLSESPLSALCEQLARFRGRRLRPEMLQRGGSPLALSRWEIATGAELIDLDAPAVLVANGLRPSEVATRRRAQTQAQARALYAAHPHAAGLRWWSTLEASWINLTLFDVRASARAGTPTLLAATHDLVAQAAVVLGLE